MAIHTTDDDRMEQALLKQLSALDNHVTDIGIFGGMNTKKGKPIRIAEYATFNEFGTKTIPQRSFMRSTFDENLQLYIGLSTLEADKILQGRQKARGLYVKMGIKIKGDTQRKITTLRTPKNAPSTIKGKRGSTNPLIDTGVMRQAIAFKVRRKSEAASDDDLIGRFGGSSLQFD